MRGCVRGCVGHFVKENHKKACTQGSLRWSLALTYACISLHRPSLLGKMPIQGIPSVIKEPGEEAKQIWAWKRLSLKS